MVIIVAGMMCGADVVRIYSGGPWATAGHAGPWSTCRTGGWASCASYKEGVRRTASGRTSGPRMFQLQTPGVTSHGGTFWAGGLSQGTPEPPRYQQGLEGRPERQGEGCCAWGWSLAQARIGPPCCQRQRLGPGPLWLLWAETEGGRDSAPSLEPAVPAGAGGREWGFPLGPAHSLWPFVPPWRKVTGLEEGARVCLMCNVPGACEVCFVHCFTESTRL